MSKVFFVIGNYAGSPEGYIWGIYPTRTLAFAAVKEILAEAKINGEDHIIGVGIEEAVVGPNGSKLNICTR